MSVPGRMTSRFPLSVRAGRPIRRAVRPLDSPQKGSYDLGLPLPGPARLRVRPGGQSPTSVLTGWVRKRGMDARGEITMSTFMASEKTASSGAWHVIDAQDQVLGRIATAAARLLQ